MRFKIVGLVLLFIFCLTASVSAENNDNDFFVKANTGYNNYLDSEIENDFPSAKVKIGYKNFYVYGSYEKLERHYRHVSFGAIDVFGTGVGYQKKINDSFSFYFDLGYFFPNAELEGDYSYGSMGGEVMNETQQAELAGFKLYCPDKYLIGGQWPNYKYDIEGDIGGSVGFEYKEEISDNGNFYFDTRYRFLKLEESVKGYDEEFLKVNGGYGVTSHKVDLSMISFGITLEYKF